MTKEIVQITTAGRILKKFTRAYLQKIAQIATAAWKDRDQKWTMIVHEGIQKFTQNRAHCHSWKDRDQKWMHYSEIYTKSRTLPQLE